MCCYSGMSDSCGRGTHEDFCVGVIFADNLSESIFDVGSHFGSGEGKSVIAINGGFNAACPSEGFFGAEENRLYFQQYPLL